MLRIPFWIEPRLRSMFEFNKCRTKHTLSFSRSDLLVCVLTTEERGFSRCREGSESLPAPAIRPWSRPLPTRRHLHKPRPASFPHRTGLPWPVAHARRKGEGTIKWHYLLPLNLWRTRRTAGAGPSPPRRTTSPTEHPAPQQHTQAGYNGACTGAHWSRPDTHPGPSILY